MLIQKGNQYIWMRFERWNLLDCLMVTTHQAGPLQWCDWRGANYKEDIKQWCLVVLLKGNVSLVPKKQTSQHQKQIVSSLLNARIWSGNLLLRYSHSCHNNYSLDSQPQNHQLHLFITFLLRPFLQFTQAKRHSFSSFLSAEYHA